MQIRQSDPTKS